MFCYENVKYCVFWLTNLLNKIMIETMINQQIFMEGWIHFCSFFWRKTYRSLSHAQKKNKQNIFGRMKKLRSHMFLRWDEPIENNLRNIFVSFSFVFVFLFKMQSFYLKSIVFILLNYHWSCKQKIWRETWNVSLQKVRTDCFFCQWSGRSGFNPKSSDTKTRKMVLDASMLNTQHYKFGSRVNWSNKGKEQRLRLHLSVTAIKKEAFESPSSTVAIFFFYFKTR